MQTIEHKNTFELLNMVKKEMEEKDANYRLERHNLKKKGCADIEKKEEMINDLEKKILVTVLPLEGGVETVISIFYFF